MAALYDRVGMTVTAVATSGTGAFTLGAAITDPTNGDYFSFADVGVPNATAVNYLAVEGNSIELGVGTYTVSGTSLSRGPTLTKSGGTKGTTTPLTFTTAAKVYIVPQAATPNQWPAAGWTTPSIQLGSAVAGISYYGGINLISNGASVLNCGSSGNIGPATIPFGVSSNADNTGGGTAGGWNLGYDGVVNGAFLKGTSGPAYLGIYESLTWSASVGGAKTNWSRMTLASTATGHQIKAEAGGTGTVRMIQIDGFTQAAAPAAGTAAGQLPAGSFALVKETGGGTVKLYYNDGGTIKSVALT